MLRNKAGVDCCHSGRDLDLPGPGPGSRTGVPDLQEILAGPGPAANFSTLLQNL